MEKLEKMRTEELSRIKYEISMLLHHIREANLDINNDELVKLAEGIDSVIHRRRVMAGLKKLEDAFKEFQRVNSVEMFSLSGEYSLADIFNQIKITVKEGVDKE